MEAELPSIFKPLFKPYRYKVYRGGRGGGKCLGKGTKVLMFDGSIKSVENIACGDFVMGPDSKARRVLTTTTGVSELFKVKQTSGMDYVVNKDHILSLKKSKSCSKDVGISSAGNPRRPNGRYPSWPDITNISVMEYLKQSKRWKENFRGYRAGLIKYKHKPVLLDPYLLGVWLGDGDSRDFVITSMDKEIKEYLKKIADDHCLKYIEKDPRGRAARIYLSKRKGVHGRFNPLRSKIDSLGVRNNKHIPDCYINNSEEVRLQLLAGLIDTDGTYNGRGSYTITLANKRLVFDVKRLVDSLGFRTSINKKRTVCSNNGAVGVAWRIGINGYVNNIPCKIKRKICAGVNPNKDKTLSYVTVEPIGVGEYFGFSIDGDHLFCLADGTVTHNSRSFSTAIIARCRANRERVLCCREIQRSIKDSVKRILDDEISRHGLNDEFESTQTELRHKRTGSIIIFAGLRSDPDAIKSMEGITICWVEEAHSCSQESLDVLIPTLRAENSEFWFSYNPRYDDDPVHTMFEDPPPNSLVVDVQHFDNPWFPKVLKDEMEYCKVKDYNKYLHVWLGQTVQQSDEQVFFGCWKEGPVPEPPPDTILKFGVDWGFSNDPTAVIRSWEAGNTLYIDYEAGGVGIKTKDIADTIRKVPGTDKWSIVADSQRPDTIDYIKDAGFNISGAKKGKGSIVDGIEYLRNFDIVIDPRCKETISEFIHYRYKKDPHTNKVTPLIIDANNHYIDALRYSHEGAYSKKGLYDYA